MSKLTTKQYGDLISKIKTALPDGMDYCREASCEYKPCNHKAGCTCVVIRLKTERAP